MPLAFAVPLRGTMNVAFVGGSRTKQATASCVGVLVGVGVAVFVGVFDGVFVGVSVFVAVGDAPVTGVFVGVEEAVRVAVAVATAGDGDGVLPALPCVAVVPGVDEGGVGMGVLEGPGPEPIGVLVALPGVTEPDSAETRAVGLPGARVPPGVGVAAAVESPAGSAPLSPPPHPLSSSTRPAAKDSSAAALDRRRGAWMALLVGVGVLLVTYG